MDYVQHNDHDVFLFFLIYFFEEILALVLQSGVIPDRNEVV